jgi:hypothetical protein
LITGSDSEPKLLAGRTWLSATDVRRLDSRLRGNDYSDGPKASGESHALLSSGTDPTFVTHGTDLTTGPIMVLRSQMLLDSATNGQPLLPKGNSFAVKHG